MVLIVWALWLPRNQGAMPQRYVIFQHLQPGGRAAQYLNGGEQPGAQHRRLTSAPSLYHRRTSAASSSDFSTKSEDALELV